MNRQQAVLQGSEQLSESSPSDLLDAQLLLSFVLQCNTAQLLTWPEKQLDKDQQLRYFQLIAQRRRGHPLAHLTGSREFWSLDFFVDNSTLIPRPETETLIEFTLEKFSGDKQIKLLDMGTGSGAIAISIASERPGWKIFASDISEPALNLAKKNCQQLQNSITLVHSNWFDNITAHDFDVIISNPPYIADNDPHLSTGDVRFEPHSALTSGSTGMDDINHLCLFARHYLTANGWLIIEHGYNQKQPVYDCFVKNKFTAIEQKQDLSGHTRMTAGKITL